MNQTNALDPARSRDRAPAWCPPDGHGADDAVGALLTELRRVSALLSRGRAAGQNWVVLAGPTTPATLTDGRSAVLHVGSGTVLTATVEPGARNPYELHVHPQGGPPLVRRFGDRADWLDEYRRCRHDVEALHDDPLPDTALTRTAAR